MRKTRRTHNWGTTWPGTRSAFTALSRRSIVVAGAILAGATLSAPGAAAAPQEVIDLTSAPSSQPRAISGPVNLASALDGLRRVQLVGGATAAAQYAAVHGLELAGGRVLVRVDTGWQRRGRRLERVSSRAIVEGVLAELASAGANIRNVWGPYIEAYVPIEALADLLSHRTVRGIHRPWRAIPAATSEGVEVVGADQWQGLVFRSPEGGLKVGVIDVGFEGFRGLQGSDLPTPDRLTTRSFTDDGDIEADTEHGTAVAEIIYDMTPEMHLFLSNIETGGDFDSAVTFMLNSGVHAINMSLGFINGGPGDGTGPIVDIADRAPDRGIPFVTSAGNQAERHWIGDFKDDDKDGIHEFKQKDESNAFQGKAGQTVEIFMSWDTNNWFSSKQDFDLFLLDGGGNVVDQSRNRQAGFAGQLATEEIVLDLPFNDTFHIVIERIDAKKKNTLELFVLFSGLQYRVPDSSLTQPGDGSSIVAVGATFWSNDEVEFFSSRGPTKDGRIKPDFGAPDGVSTESFGPLDFFGTSAASPHVVGGIALLVGRLGVVSPQEAVEMLVARAVDLSPEGRDNKTGHGRLSLLAPEQ